MQEVKSVQIYTWTTRELMKEIALLLKTENWKNVVIQNLHLNYYGDLPSFTSVSVYKREEINLGTIYCMAREKYKFILSVNYIEETETILINLVSKRNAESITD